ncbi:MAG: universal stress protein [Proteobacteria bacterium]|nr:universal stress protein [Pseudomonadota bacterium]
MLETILVAIDFSQQSEHAMDRAMAVAEAMGSKLVLLWVESEEKQAASSAAIYGHSVPEIERLIMELHTESAARLEKLADQARQRGLKVNTRVASGHPDEVIVTMAETIDADLIVTGTKGLTGVKRFFLGSVAEKVVRMSATNVMVARQASRPLLRRVLVPTDFSATSEAALRIAVALAGRVASAGGETGTEDPLVIELLHAWQFPPGTHGLNSPYSIEGPLAELRDEILAAGQAEGTKLVEFYATEGCEIRFVQEHGVAAALIQDRLEAQLETEPYDLVVMGTHGYRGFRRFLLGSAAEATVRHAPCSVLVTHGDSQTPREASR